MRPRISKSDQRLGSAAGSALASLGGPDRTSVDLVALHRSDRRLGGLVIGELNVTEAAGAAVVAVKDDVNVLDSVTGALESLAERVEGRVPG